MSESEMVCGCKEGDNHARKELYELYGGQLLSLCYRYVGERKAAEDLLHDGFLKVFTSIHSFSYKVSGSLNAWLNKIFLNLSLEYLRKKDLLREGLALDEIKEFSEEPEPETDNIPIEAMLHLIAELPTGYRTVFNLYVLEEWSHKEIAQHLHISEKTSTSQLSRARKIIANQIRGIIQEQRKR